MNTRSSLEIASGILLIFLGVLFIWGLGLDFVDLTTDAIFIVFGVLLIRSGYRKNRKESSQLVEKEENRASRRAKKNKNRQVNSN